MTEIFALVQIIAIDALMAADNAIVVGMAAASVPIDKRKKVIVFGTMAAVVLRIAFALVAVELLKIIGLTFAGGLLLAYVSYDMYRELRRGGEEAPAAAETKNDMSFLRAVGLIVAADLSMSLDNVLAVAGAANGHLGLLVTGLLISVTLMAVAASFLASIIQKHRWVAWLGLLMVAYVALNMIYRGANEVVAATVAFL
ncbi:MAG: YjbE family putative metal transport protein [Minisyncoccota bacterium]